MTRLGRKRLWCPETINEVIGIDDRHVAVRGYKSLFVWDHRDGEPITGVDARSISHGDAPVRADVGGRCYTRVSADGRWVAAASLGSRIRVFDNATGEMKFAEDPEYGFDAVAFSLDGEQLVGTAESAYVFTAGVETPVRVAGPCVGARLDANGDIVGAPYKGMVGRWRLDGTELARVSVRHKIESLSFSADGRYGAATTIGVGGLCMWELPDVVVADLACGRAIVRFHDPAEVSRLAVISPDARWLGLHDGRMVRLMPAGARPAWTTPPVIVTWSGYRHVSFSGDDRALLTSNDGVLAVVAVPSGEVLARTPTSTQREVQWSPCARFLVEVGLDDRTLAIRSSGDLAVIGALEFPDPIDALAISPDGERIAVADGPTILIRPVSTTTSQARG
jgi:WD40 repeat protein